MKLILKIALRDLINSKRFSFLFILNLALGILGFVLIHSFKGSVNDTLAARSKILLGSDISLTGRRALNEQEYEKIQKFFEDSPRLEHRFTVTNPNTGVENEFVIAGLSNFFG